MLKRRKNNKRFNLLLLQENEIYYNDFAATYFSANAKTKYSGRLHFCSHSLIFVPDDMKVAIMYLEYTKMDNDESFIPFTPSKSYEYLFKPFAADSLFSLKMDQISEMKKQNKNHPYIVRKEETEIIFGITYITAAEFINKVKPVFQLWSHLKNVSRFTIMDRIRRNYQSGQTQFSFDVTWLEDFREQQLYETNGVRVTPLVDTPGRFLLTNARIYFQPFNNIGSKPVKKYQLKSIVRVVKRRHVLRHTGIEFYLKKNTSIFFSFNSQAERDEVFLKILQQPALNNLSFDDQSSMTLRWQNGLISNFDYLMYLNFVADRSFNDLTQYPVFPWVIADYTSEKLDLTGDHTNTFRDLTKPVGALNDKRLKKMQDRYREMPDPKFLYGTHYSTPGYVLYYLIRQAPEYMLRLQSGKFDAPDRVFNSIAQTWTAVLENDADVKELIPEFYQSTGEFLLNTQQLDLGTKHNGQRVNNVVLPPWAENEKEFIYMNRLALESDYVSDNLHHWIDLIFGYKQRGTEAVKANNLFYYLTYEGAVDIDKITDAMERHSIEMQIREFGQTPKQVFTQPHPKRRAGTDISKLSMTEITFSNTIRLDPISAVRNLDVPDPVTTPKHGHPRTGSDDYFNSTMESIGLATSDTPSSGKPKEDEVSVDDLLMTNFTKKSSFARPSKLLASLEKTEEQRPSTPPSPVRRSRGLNRINSSSSLVPSSNVGLTSVPKFKRMDTMDLHVSAKLHRETIGSAIVTLSDSRIYTASHDACVKIYSIESKRQLRRIADMGDMALSSCVALPASLTNESKVLIVSSWDNRVYAYSIDYGRILDTVTGHDDAVAKISISDDTLMSCSWDSSVKLWKCAPTGFEKVPILEFTDHQTPVQCCSFDASGNLAVSGSEDGEIAVYDIRQKKNLYLFTGHFDALRDISFLGGDSRRIVTCSKDKTIKMFELNGSEVYTYKAEESLRCIATDGDIIYSGGDSGILKMWDVKDGSFLGQKSAHPGSAITCLTIAPDGQSIVNGAKDGNMNYFK